MYSFRFTLLLVAVLSLQSFMQAPAPAASLAECLEDVARSDFAAKSKHQNDLRDLLVARRPGFTALADINRDVQLLFAEMRFARFQYLISRDPERLDRANGLSGFRNFNWTDEDLQRLLADNPSYRAQVERLEALKVQNNGHPDWPAMRAFVREELSRDGDFKQLIAAFQEHSTKAEARLLECRH